MKKHNPEMHTAEHVLNQTMVRMFGCERAFSTHLERKKSKVDYRFHKALTPEEESEIELKVNQAISEHMDVSFQELSVTEAEANYNLGRLPEGAGDRIRIVCIGDYDASPCIGDHVENTREIGTFVMGNTSFDNDVLRIRFKLKRPQ